MSTLDPSVTGRRHGPVARKAARPQKARAPPKTTRPEVSKKVRAKRAASAMATVEDLATELGIGLNQAYALVQMKVVPAMRVDRRYLIPRTVIAKIASGEMLPQVSPEDVKRWRDEREAAAQDTA
jgi:hypothetical protein